MSQNRLGRLCKLVDGPRLGRDVLTGPLEEEACQGDSAEARVGTADPVQTILEGEPEEVSNVTLGRVLPPRQAGRLLLQENGQQPEC
jgi:hypothetical protein